MSNWTPHHITWTDSLINLIVFVELFGSSMPRPFHRHPPYSFLWRETHFIQHSTTKTLGLNHETRCSLLVVVKRYFWKLADAGNSLKLPRLTCSVPQNNLQTTTSTNFTKFRIYLNLYENRGRMWSIWQPHALEKSPVAESWLWLNFEFRTSTLTTSCFRFALRAPTCGK